MLKRVLAAIGIVLAFVLVAGAAFVGWEAHAFDASLAKVYDVPLPEIARSTDPATIARGKHLAESITACATRDCHGADLGGGQEKDMGALGFFAPPNVTTKLGDYSDGELARLILHGVKRDGRSVRFMPSQDMVWLPDDDVRAIISYLRTVPPVARPRGETHIGLVAKVLDRIGLITLDVARRVDHQHRATAARPEPTAAYGAYLSRLCTGCHGQNLSGGPIPGAPPSLPVPKNITPDATGIQAYSFPDFDRLFSTGVKRDGKQLDPFMPLDAFKNFDATERQALWAYLRTVPPRPFGGR
jgi:mono/diheme cytochrome c family protein